MMAPSNVLFFNKDGSACSGMSSKRYHFSSKAYTAILKDGLFGNRPSVAQTVLGVTNRTMTRVEDKGYSLTGLSCDKIISYTYLLAHFLQSGYNQLLSDLKYVIIQGHAFGDLFQ